MGPCITRAAGEVTAQMPDAAFPCLVARSRDDAGKVHALQPRPFAGAGDEAGNVKTPLRIMRDHRVGRTNQADAAGQRAGVDAGQANLAARLQPLAKGAL